MLAALLNSTRDTLGWSFLERGAGGRGREFASTSFPVRAGEGVRSWKQGLELG